MVAEKGASIFPQDGNCPDDDTECLQSSKKLIDPSNPVDEEFLESQDAGRLNGHVDEPSVHSDLSMDSFCEVIVTFRCKFCDCVCNDKISMKKHVIKAHSDRSKSISQEKPDKGTQELDKSTVVSSEQLDDINSGQSGTDDKQEVFFCSECSIIFSSAKLCCDHMILVHNLSEFSTELIRENPLNSPPVVNKRKRIRCSTQEKISKSNEKKSKSLPSNSTYLCKLCKKKFKSTVALQTHEKCHIFVEDGNQINNQAKKNSKNSIKGYVCCYCESDSNKFLTWAQCVLHLWREHQVDCDLYSCSVCKFKTSTLSKLKDHERLHGSEANFKCNICRKTFKQFKQLKTHEKYHKTNMTELPPPSEARWYTPKECPVCHRILSDSKCLKKHISAVHNKMKPYSCNICGHTSARKAELQLHVRQHTGEKPYKCEHPGCNFTTGDHNCLRKHKLRHGGVRPYKCPHCDYCVIQSYRFKKHVLATHPEKDVVFVCPSCPLVSVNEKTFEAHRKDHQEGRLLSDNNESNSSQINNNTKHGGVDEGRQGSNESGESNDGKSSAKFWLRDEDSIEVVDTGGITIPAMDSETRGEEGIGHQFKNSFNPISSINNNNSMTIKTCQISSETQNPVTTFGTRSKNSQFSIITEQQVETPQEKPKTTLCPESTPTSKSTTTNKSKRKRGVQPKGTQETSKSRGKTKKKVLNEKPKKKNKKIDDAPNQLKPSQNSNQSSIRTMLSQNSNSSPLSQPHSSTFGTSIDETRAINMVAELLADADSNSLHFLDPILSMGISDMFQFEDFEVE